MINGKFISLGMENSGKSAFLVTFLQQLRENKKFDINSVVISDIPGYKKHQFCVSYEQQKIINLQIPDYTGALFKEMSENILAHENLEQDIFDADILYVFVDGNYFMNDSRQQKCRNIKRNFTRFVTPYISGYSGKNNGKVPVTFFIVTKCFGVLQKNTIAEIHSILKETFSSVFDSESIGYIEPYAICVDTEKNYSVKIPFLTGIYALLCQENDTSHKNIIKTLLETELQIYQNFMITDFEKGILDIKVNAPDSRTVPEIIKDTRNIADLDRQADKYQRKIAELEQLLSDKEVEVQALKKLAEKQNLIIKELENKTHSLQKKIDSFQKNNMNALQGSLEGKSCYISPQCASGKVLSLQDEQTASGTPVVIWENHKNWNQKFIIQYVSEDYFVLRNTHSRKVLDVDYGIAENSRKIQLWDFNGTSAQLWKLKDAGNGCFIICSKLNDEYCLDVAFAGSQNGTSIQLHAQNGSDAQKFQLIPVKSV